MYIFETHTFFVNVTVKTDWSIHVRWHSLGHVFGVWHILKTRALASFVELEPVETMKSSDSQIEKSVAQVCK